MRGTESRAAFALCGFIALQWAWASIFHESAYWTFEEVPLPFVLNAAILFCFVWTAGIAVGAAAALAAYARGGGAADFHAIFALQMLSGIAFYAGVLFGGGIVMSTVALAVLSASSMCAMLICLRSVIADARRILLHLAVMYLIAAGGARILILACGAAGLIGLPLAFFHMVLLPVSYGLLQVFRSSFGGEGKGEEEAPREGTRASALTQSLDPPVPAGIGRQNASVWLHLFLYSCVFGLLHRLHGAVAATPEMRITAYVVAAFVAVGIFMLAFRRGALRAQLLWANVSRFVFPALVVSCLLLPLLDGSASLVVFVLSETAQGFYLLIVLLACALVAQESHRSLGSLVSKAMLIWHVGMVVGAVPATMIRAFAHMDSLFFSMFSTVVFLILVVATFELDVQSGMKTYWGLVQEYAPRAMFDERVHRFCEEKAKECGLTARELEVFELLAKGQRANDIKDQLTLSITTVRTHMQNVYQKLGIHSQKELTAMVREGLESKSKLG